MNLKFQAVQLVGKMQWFCDACLKSKLYSDPMKSKPTPHCMKCGKHHQVHIDCNGKSIVPPPIDYMQLFYSCPNELRQEVGRA